MTTQLNFPWVPDPRTLCEIIPVGFFFFKPLSFGIICYVTGDNDARPFIETFGFGIERVSQVDLGSVSSHIFHHKDQSI